MPSSVRIESVIQELYAHQVQRFSFDMAIAMLGQRDLSAAEAAIASPLEGNPGERVVSVLCGSMDEVRLLKKYVKVLGRLAGREGLRRIDLVYEDRRFSASPGMAGIKQRKPTMTNPIIALPGIQVAQMRLSRPLLEVMLEFIENPDWRCGVVSLQDQHQVIVTEASAQMILGREYDRLMMEGLEDEVRSRVAAATNLKREDYFYLPDLDVFMRETRQRLAVNDRASKIELSWRGQGRDGSWKQFTHEYRLVGDERGAVYHVAKNLDCVEIAAPEAING